MKPQKYLLFLLIVLSMVLLGACGGDASAPVEEASAGSVAVVMTGPWDDNSWNEAAYNALQALEAEGVKTAFSENISDTDVARVMREYVDQGFEVVVAHSFIYQDATFQVASEAADTNFAWAGGINNTSANVADYDQPFYEAAYPIGVLAGHMSESGVLGALYGFDIPVCHAMGEAFLAGAQSVNPDATLILTSVGDWADIAKAKEAALAQADAGVDFWIECGEGPALGAIEAAKEVGGYATGYVGDMTENGPDVVLANLVWNLEPLFAQMLADAQGDSFADTFYRYGIAEGAMQVGYNEALKDSIPAEAIEAVETAMQDIASGALEVPFIPE
ncbi:MAG: BMP family ABC transporter substrate-binding protein [Chloroflexi bacterium]|nr:MAG: BMP family ABC transporter substrate-binding protein [Chloroflexota bacterium]MBL1196710.1 BMP family ABC transporter substrate-binding protein [Chloroflexota bacterium]NOH14003.1 BMP family protein [Chloroflexota bacterium]